MEFGANINERLPRTKTTILHHAARDGHASLVKFLLERGAKIYILDREDKSPLELSVRNNHTAIVQNILEYDPDDSDLVDAVRTAQDFLVIPPVMVLIRTHILKRFQLGFCDTVDCEITMYRLLLSAV